MRQERPQRGGEALERLPQEACEGLQAPLPFRRRANEHRMFAEVLAGLRRELDKSAKGRLKAIKPLLDARRGQSVGTQVLNTEAHASEHSASFREVSDTLDRIDELRRHWTCPECETRIWHSRSARAGWCKCGVSRFPAATRPIRLTDSSRQRLARSRRVWIM